MISATRRPEKTLPLMEDYRRLVSSYATIYRTQGMEELRQFIGENPMPSYTKFATLQGLDLHRSGRIRFLDLYADLINDARLPQQNTAQARRAIRKAFGGMLELLS